MEAAEASPPLRVLVVDDLKDARLSLRLLRELWGHEVHEAADGLSALAAARTFRPDAILLDIQLPRLDGYAVARRLREIPGLEHTCLIAATASGMARDLARAREAGFHHHLIKPFDLDTLQRFLGRCQEGAFNG